MTHPRLIRAIAVALLAGSWDEAALIRRLRTSFGTRRRWIDALVRRVTAEFAGPPPPSLRCLVQLLQSDDALREVLLKGDLNVVRVHLTPTPMVKALGAASAWKVRSLVTDDDLSQWLDVTHEHLAWFANVHSRESRRRHGEALRNYFYKWIPKRSGGWRLLEMPKSKLKAMQRRILLDILDKIPPNPNAHGFRKGGSIKQFVLPHVRQPLVLRMDLKDFFISVQASRVHALFRAAGYSEYIARMLTGLCTNSVPSGKMRLPDSGVRLTGPQQMQLRTPHLPQGAPTSPALANLCAFRFDMRVTALAKKYSFNYSRYADDLLFSGPARSKTFLKQFQIWVGAIALEENFEVNTRKSRTMRQSTRQHAAGLVLNAKPSISRMRYDTLKAILHNCVKHGPESQNREKHAQFRAHLLGRVGYVMQINSERGKRLRAVFERIVWPGE